LTRIDLIKQLAQADFGAPEARRRSWSLGGMRLRFHRTNAPIPAAVFAFALACARR
jgi:hypothetical protein